MHSMFDKIDGFNFALLGFNPVGALKNVKMWRKYVTTLFLVSFTCWVLFGWESTWLQPFTYAKSVPLWVFGQTTLNQIHIESTSFYGVGPHLSSVVIYSFCFVLLSVHLEKVGIKKSLNFASAFALTAMSVGAYELVYNILYSNLQNQPWTFCLQWKQGLNISMFTFFTALGILTLVYLYSVGYRPNFGKTTKLLFLCSLITYGVWVFYPLHTTTLTMETTAGTWTSTPFFPQTMYAVDVDPLNDRAIGEPVFIENNVLHFVNVLNKAFVSLMVLSFVIVKRRNEIEKKVSIKTQS